MALDYVHICQGFPPFQRIVRLATATDIDRSYQLMAPGKAVLQVSLLEPAQSHIIRGRYLLIESMTKRPWLGRIDYIEEEQAKGAYTIHATDMVGMMGERKVEGQGQMSGVAGGLAEMLLQTANMRNPFGLSYDPHRSWSGSVVGNLSLGGTSLLRGLQQLAQASGDEWTVEIDVDQGGCQAWLVWTWRRGSDRTASLVVRDGYHVGSVKGRQDNLSQRTEVSAVAGLGRWAQRPTYVRLAGAASGYTGGEQVDAIGGADHHVIDPSLRREHFSIMPRVGDYGSLMGHASAVLRSPINSAQRIEMTLNDRIDWRAVQVGDYITLVRRTGVTATEETVRITAMQPDIADMLVKGVA